MRRPVKGSNGDFLEGFSFKREKRSFHGAKSRAAKRAAEKEKTAQQGRPRSWNRLIKLYPEVQFATLVDKAAGWRTVGCTKSSLTAIAIGFCFRRRAACAHAQRQGLDGELSVYCGRTRKTESQRCRAGHGGRHSGFRVKAAFRRCRRRSVMAASRRRSSLMSSIFCTSTARI